MSKCPFCDAGWPVTRHDFKDGRGSKRIHTRGSVAFNNYETRFCTKNSWFRRHRFVTALIVFCIACAVVAVFSQQAQAHDSGQWENSDPVVREWYQALMQPDVPLARCCGEADAYWADEIHVRDGKTYATITDDRDDAKLGRPHIENGTEVEIPNHKLKWDSGNPTGHGVVFLSRGGFVFCYVQPGGA